MKIICSVWKQPGPCKTCETCEVEITEEDIKVLALAKAQAATGWEDSDIYHNEIDCIRP